MTDLPARRGDTFRHTATITKADGSAYDLAGRTLWFSVKERSGDEDEDALASLYWISGGASSGIAVATPASGIAVVTLTAIQTGALEARAYHYDLQVMDPSGDVWTVDDGKFVVAADVTRRTTAP